MLFSSFMYLRSGAIHRLTKENVSRVPNTAGVYKFYNRNKKPIYIGTTKGNYGSNWGPKPHQRYRYGLKHRIGSYVQKDDPREHPTKPALRKQIRYFSYKPIRSHTKRRELEKKIKKPLRYNYL